MLRSDRVQLAGVASRELAKAQAMAAPLGVKTFASYEDLLKSPDIDFVYLPLPKALIPYWCQRALEHGKSVLAEKTFSDDPVIAKRLIDFAERNGLTIYENYSFHLHEQFLWLRNELARGTIGELRLLRSSFCFPHIDFGDYRYKRELGGGSLFDAGVYSIKAATLLMGAQPTLKSVQLVQDRGFLVDTSGVVTLRQENTLAQLAFGFGQFYQCNLELLGTLGKITLNRAFTCKPDLKPPVTLELPGAITKPEIPADDQYLRMLAHFSRLLSDDAERKKSHAELLGHVSLLAEVVAGAQTHPSSPES